MIARVPHVSDVDLVTRMASWVQPAAFSLPRTTALRIDGKLSPEPYLYSVTIRASVEARTIYGSCFPSLFLT